MTSVPACQHTYVGESLHAGQELAGPTRTWGEVMQAAKGKWASEMQRAACLAIRHGDDEGGWK